MSWLDLLWLPPVMLAVALVLGSTGRTGWHEISRSVLHTFVALTIGVVCVGAAIHLISRIFA
jgi:hypothetical protein